MIPASISKLASKRGAKVSRLRDSLGKHVAYVLHTGHIHNGEEWRVYRHSVSGMKALLRNSGGYHA